MNMNKNMKFIILFILSFTFSINVYAEGCNIYASQGKSVCESNSSNGYICEWDGTKKGGSRCFQGNVPTDETISNIKSCGDIKESSICSSTSVNGKSCIWKQNACHTAFENNSNNDSYQVETEGYQNNKGQTITIQSNAENNKVPCSTYGTEQQCGTIGKCKWNKGENECQEVYVAEMPCSDDNIKIALRFFGYLLMVAKLAVPLIIIVMGIFDLFKSVIDKDEKSLTKQIKILLMRIVGGVFIFFLPTIVYALFSISSDLKIVEDNKYQTCVDCLLKPTICQTNENNAG